MIEVIELTVHDDREIAMCEMKPLQVGIITGGSYEGNVVMRTAVRENFEVIDLSQPGIDSYWRGETYQPVRLLGKGESVTIKLTNDD